MSLTLPHRPSCQPESWHGIGSHSDQSCSALQLRLDTDSEPDVTQGRASITAPGPLTGLHTGCRWCSRPRAHPTVTGQGLPVTVPGSRNTAARFGGPCLRCLAAARPVKPPRRCQPEWRLDCLPGPVGRAGTDSGSEAPRVKTRAPLSILRI